MHELIRTVRLRPYRRGIGPTFTLRVFDTGRRIARGTSDLAYELRQHDGKATCVLFAGDGFSSSPMYADDSDKTIAALLGFLTLRPGDTDAEYFEKYTHEQMEYCTQHAETLACEAMNRFGED